MECRDMAAGGFFLLRHLVPLAATGDQALVAQHQAFRPWHIPGMLKAALPFDKDARLFFCKAFRQIAHFRAAFPARPARKRASAAANGGKRHRQ